jgi:hypothetical protein
MAVPQVRNIMDSDQDPVHADMNDLKNSFHNNYGCYVYFSQDVPEDKYSGGIPVDPLDAMSKVYRGQMDCADEEHAAEGETAYTVDYENPYDEPNTPIWLLINEDFLNPAHVPSFEQPEDSLILSECDRLQAGKPNEELCKAACYAETRFMAEFFYLRYVEHNDQTTWFSSEFMHSNGFDPSTECLATSLGSGINGGVIPAENTVCCGANPRRGKLTELANIRVCSADGQTVCDLLNDPSCA